ncbi:hypothetical protein GCG54_00008827 [Colletotrichum gloeosporioides]|uniref:Uncharacterized protein n=1 Tax=Colletotrichum gloeosporioides TaxID=474922 RepID=A0A8H4CNW3_COLGL|nr:uncharacterized protein GCG54_00008827 [Colletotrichum gloeosporioides]KAF3807370.1 hypothetical protein GCG54_00008827 [Colletotrichum gloeosporioides]
MTCYKSPLGVIKHHGLWPFIKDAVSGQIGHIAKTILPDRKNDRASGSVFSLGLGVAKTAFSRVTIEKLIPQLTRCTIAKSAMSPRAHTFDDTHSESFNVTLAKHEVCEIIRTDRQGYDDD